MTIGGRITELRKKSGLSMRDLANKTGLTQPQISNYENDQQVPSAAALIKLSKELDISIDYILTGEVVEIETLIQKIRNIPVKHLSEINSHVDSILKSAKYDSFLTQKVQDIVKV